MPKNIILESGGKPHSATGLRRQMREGGSRESRQMRGRLQTLTFIIRFMGGLAAASAIGLLAVAIANT